MCMDDNKSIKGNNAHLQPCSFHVVKSTGYIYVSTSEKGKSFDNNIICTKLLTFFSSAEIPRTKERMPENMRFRMNFACVLRAILSEFRYETRNF